MYSDFRFCRYCSDVGLYTDGENYCTKCDSYLCLSCSRTHGQNCERLRHSETSRKRSGNAFSDSDSDTTKYKNATGPLSRLYGSFHNNNGIDGIETIATKPSKNVPDVSKQSISFSCDGDGIIYGHTTNGAMILNNHVAASNGIQQNTNISHFDTKHLQPKASYKEPQKPSVSNLPRNGRQERYSDYGGIIRIMKAWDDTDQSQSDRRTMFVCTPHPDMNLEYYCKNHDDVCCDTCMNTTHKQCMVQPINEVTQPVRDNREMSALKTKLKELSQSCDDTKLKLLKLQTPSNIDNIGSISIPYGGNYMPHMCKPTPQPNTNSRNNCCNRTETDRAISACKDLQEHISMCQLEIRNAEISKSEVNLFTVLHRDKNNTESIERNLQTIASCIQLTNASSAAVADEMHTRSAPTWNITSNSSNVGSTLDATVIDRNVSKRLADNDLGLKPYIIGDVILKPCDNNPTFDHDVPKDLYYNSFSSDEEDDEHNVNRGTNNMSPVNTKTSTCNSRKDVSITKRNDTWMHTSPKDKIKIHGLATAFYMNDSNKEVSDDLQILRLHSPEPERTINLNTCTLNFQTKPSSTNVAPEVMSESNKTDRNRHMIKWQDRKMLQSVELRHDKGLKETNRSNISTKRTKKIFESSESDLKEVMKNENIDKQRKARQLQKVRKENSREVPIRTTHRRKVKSNRNIKTNQIKYEVETDATRLKKWIKQTEDMNKAFIKTQKSARMDGYKINTGGVSGGFVANEDNTPETDVDHLSLMAIRTKDAKLLKQIRVPSAKSQASDSDTNRYKRQTYACRPRNILNLYAEHVIILPSDKLDCKISGVACMPDGRIVVSDYNNTNIKLFRVGWNNGSALHLDDVPHDVAVVSNTLLAVIAGLAFDRMYLVSVGQYMAIRRRFKTGCVCKAISSFQSHIYLLCLFHYKTEVRVMNTDGVVSIRFAFEHVIPSPIGIAVNQINGLILISDKTEGVFKCESGRVMSRSFDANIGEYHKVTCDTNDNVYVSTEGPSGIYEVSRDNTHLMSVVQSEHIHGVKAIAYNEALNLFVVCCSETDTISIFSIRDTERQVK